MSFCRHYFSPLNTLMRKGKDLEPDPDPHLFLMDPDPGGPKTCGSGSGSGSGSPTLQKECLFTCFYSMVKFNNEFHQKFIWGLPRVWRPTSYIHVYLVTYVGAASFPANFLLTDAGPLFCISWGQRYFVYENCYSILGNS
jgi:hypothetical protein